MPIREDGRFVVSFSEVKMWHECPHRWKKFYQDGAKALPEFNLPSQATAWGSSFHTAVERQLLGKPHKWKEAWGEELKACLDNPLVEVDPAFVKKVESVSDELVERAPRWLVENFGAYDLLGSEIPFEIRVDSLCETFGLKMGQTLGTSDTPELWIKGFIDLVIRDHKGKVHLIDWKTTEKGWGPWKRRDAETPRQLILYKAATFAAFASAGANVDIKVDSRSTGTSFALVKPDLARKPFELFTVGSGPKALTESVSWLTKACRGMYRSFNPTNPEACRFCPFSGNPEWCNVPRGHY